jgi:hypothetical protein
LSLGHLASPPLVGLEMNFAGVGCMSNVCMSEDAPDSIASCKSVGLKVERSSSEPLLSTLMPRGEWGTLEPMMNMGFVPKVGLGVDGTAMAKMSCM